MKNYKLYLDNEVIKSHETVCEKEFYSKEAVSVKNIKNAFVLPQKSIVLDNGCKIYEGGVVDENHIFINEATHDRGFADGVMNKAYDFVDDKVEKVHKKVMYAGIFANHFGHFLVEASNRLWYWCENRDENLDIVFITAKKVKVLPQVWEFFELLGIPREKIHFINQVTQFDEVVVPAASSAISKWYNDKFLFMYQEIAKNIEPANFEKIYFSRAKFMTKTGGSYGEAEIQKIFENNGYKIVYPEKISLKEQIALVRGAKEVAGVMGTAMHLAVFGSKDQKLCIINRSDEIVEEQYLINQALGCSYDIVGANANPFPVVHSNGPTLLAVNDNVYKYCLENGMTVNPKVVNKIKNKFLKKFYKDYFVIYAKEHRNKNLAELDSLLAKRIKLYFADFYTPLYKKINVKIKSIFAK